MTSGRRSRALRRAAHEAGRLQPLRRDPRPGIRDFDGNVAEGVGTQAAWCKSMSDLDAARKTVHDSLIQQMGPLRRGPVYFVWKQGAAALRLLDSHVQGEASPLHAQYDRGLRAKLTAEGGWIVVAMAAGDEP